MGALERLSTAAGYAFAAWLFAALLVFAVSSGLPHGWRVAAQCSGLLASFGPVFSLYFRRARPLPPAAAAAVAVGLIAGLDLALVAPHLPHLYDLYLRFWDWQVPAALVAATVYAAGKRAQPVPEGALK